jgi:membrane protein DedA with SNARE-associated domain
VLDNIQQLISEYGAYVYALIFIWTFFEGETFVIFAGFAASVDYLDFTGVFFAAWLGSFAGDQLYFWIGRRWGTILLQRIPRWRPGVEMALDWLRRYDVWFILTFRFVYGVRNFASFAMGMSGIHPLRFASLNFAAACAWALSYSGFGYLFGEILAPMLDDIVLTFGVAMLGIFAVSLGFAGYMNRRHQRMMATEAARAAQLPAAAPAVVPPDTGTR